MQELLGWLKKGIWIVIAIAIFILYDKKGLLNPNTICVLIIILAFVIYFKLEINEEVEVNERISREEEETGKNNSSKDFGNESRRIGPGGSTEKGTIKEPQMMTRKMTKMQRLVRSRSRSRSNSANKDRPVQNNNIKTQRFHDQPSNCSGSKDNQVGRENQFSKRIKKVVNTLSNLIEYDNKGSSNSED